ncbi:MAG TPA: hypothetical protein VNE42_08565, partial [Acidimicrobiales bacterium]|nr:hypothetical protein [Acidimicrobiales bacterium]
KAQCVRLNDLREIHDVPQFDGGIGYANAEDGIAGFGGSDHLEPGAKIEEGIVYAAGWLDAEHATEVVGTLLRYTNGTLERWTTIDMAAREIAAEGKPVTPGVVLAHIESIPEWAPKLKREVFEPAKIASTLAGLRKEGFLDDAKAEE